MALLASAAAAAAAAITLDATLGCSADIRQLKMDREFQTRLQRRIKQLGNRVTLYHLLEIADRAADALWFEGKSWNYQAMKIEVDRLAKGFETLGVKVGDYVAVYMTNSPEMIFVVYALSKMGAAPALINSTLRGDTLIHCIKLAKSKQIICTPDLVEFASTAAQSCGGTFQCVTLNLGSFRNALPSNTAGDIAEFPSSAEDFQMTSIDADQGTSIVRGIADVAALIYTSGTTGYPKACRIRNLLICITSCPSSADMSKPKKYFPIRTYGCMPLFHGTTFLTGLCYSVGTSGTFCLSRKFSASKFWQDMVESRATRMLYVGELCRYLCASKPSSLDRAHRCIVATGNGLQKDVWTQFTKRFGVSEIREYYRSTEGIVKYDNRSIADSGAGKVGYKGIIRRSIENDIFIVKFDYENEQPIRDSKTGFCIPAALGEPGEAIGRIRSMATYTDYLDNPDATNAKILRNVFEEDDIFQRSGDLMVQERLGWVRFHDRIGDTFRWKGENVSAGEISGYICELQNVRDAIIVGKSLAKYDGQAGAAAIILESKTFESKFISTLYSKLRAKGVPAYAIPRLVTITDDIAVNSTFKHAKQALKTKSWNPEHQSGSGSDYWLDGKHFKPLDKGSWLSIEAGSAKF